jgi:hypothetical protein
VKTTTLMLSKETLRHLAGEERSVERNPTNGSLCKPITCKHTLCCVF